MTMQHVDGENRGKVVLYALSTCAWCKKAKKLLEELGVEYDFIDVDLLERKEKKEVMKELRKWNPRGSFPTLVIDEKSSIRGYDEERTREALAG